MTTNLVIWIIAALVAIGVIWRPFDWAEAWWATGGAVLLVLLRLITPQEAWTGIAKGTDVYLFLIGMMLLAEIARGEGLFDFLAAHATKAAKGSARRLFLLIYGVGILVTAFLSNDATAIVLTPAVAAAARTARVERPLPYLLICAFIANAASFVLPISNPANLVIYGSHMPPLMHWLPLYLVPSLLSIIATYVALHATQRNALRQDVAGAVPVPPLSGAGTLAALGLIATAIALLACSALDLQLGLPTAIAGILTVAMVLLHEKKNPWHMVRHIAWSVLPLVAGLFVLVEALAQTGLITAIGTLLRTHATAATTWSAGVGVALVSNLINNLPTGLIAAGAMQSAHASDAVTSAMLIGVDLGPNLSVTGSLATILWLVNLRREGQHIDALSFLKLGCVVMPPALILALGAAWLLTP